MIRASAERYVFVVTLPRINALSYVKVIVSFLRFGTGMVVLPAVCTLWHAMHTGGSRLSHACTEETEVCLTCTGPNSDTAEIMGAIPLVPTPKL